ncbi:MAG TPA: hypothetical protein VHI54_06360, partial [Actinomycetota bacterium]|nr:hypothetical protein [Actinomycetota bacterium]
VALACGILAFTAGILGRRPSTRVAAPNRRIATTAIILGVIAMGLGIVGAVLVGGAFAKPVAG